MKKDCGCAGTKFISMCAFHQGEEIEKHRRLMGYVGIPKDEECCSSKTSQTTCPVSTELERLSASHPIAENSSSLPVNTDSTVCGGMTLESRE